MHLSKQYAKELLNLSMPIIMGNLGFVLIGAGDVLIAGRHSTNTLAAISIANAILSCIFTFGVGLVASASPVLSNYRGEKKGAKNFFFPTIKFAFTIATIMMFVVLAFIPIIDLFHFHTELVPLIKEYMYISAFATFGIYLHVAVKEFLQAFEIVLFPNLLTIFSVFLNILLNIVFVFGYGIIPSMGVKGIAIASLVVRYFMGIVLLIYCLKIMNLRNVKVNNNYYFHLIKIGLPISMAVLIEFIAFNSVAIIMGKISGVYAAAQALCCTLANITFMVPFAISNAISVKVGYANGAKNIDDLKKYSYTGIFMSVLFMICSSFVFLTCPEFLAKLFTQDTNLINICVPIIFILAFFEIFDGMQISLSGIFKGIKKTKIVMISNFVAYWLIALPIGYIFAIKHNFGLKGFWIGIIISSVVLSSMMFVILQHYIKKLSAK